MPIVYSMKQYYSECYVGYRYNILLHYSAFMNHKLVIYCIISYTLSGITCLLLYCTITDTQSYALRPKLNHNSVSPTVLLVGFPPQVKPKLFFFGLFAVLFFFVFNSHHTLSTVYCILTTGGELLVVVSCCRTKTIHDQSPVTMSRQLGPWDNLVQTSQPLRG